MKYLKFLRDKAVVYPLATIARLEFESFMMGFLSLAPTLLGVLLRGFFSKILFKELRGFPWIQPRCTIVHSERIRIGTHFAVNSGTYINGVGGIDFGNFVLIGSNVTISSGEHPIAGSEPPVFSRVSIPKKLSLATMYGLELGLLLCRE